MFDNKIFYHSMIRKYVVAMGALFNNVHIQHFRKEGDTIAVKTQKVPLWYGPKKHFIAKFFNASPETITDEGTAKFRIGEYLPRMAFILSGIEKDPSRNIDPMLVIRKQDDTNPDIWRYVRSAAPYKYTFELSILASKLDHSQQILEQIVAYFQAPFSMNIKELPALDVVRECPIRLITTNPTLEIEYDETGDSVYTWDLEFEMDGYMYQYIENSALIKKVSTYLYDKSEMLDYIALIEQEVTPLTASPIDPYTVTKTVTEVP